ncbi:hypothetical protein [Taibaiella chishuiensis]|uniref:hypothetical protein n=1 Tax=Taibaiella chishuiensis TaxID=1434707 RepID=UPI0015E75775|nr:hypothetical protein [Taibaiella chishuiensis]
MRKVYGLLLALPLSVSCTGRVKPLDRAVLDLEHFPFTTTVTELLPEHTEDNHYAGWYKVKGTSIEVDTVYDDELSDAPKAQWIEYRSRGYSSRDELARFDDLGFNTVNLVATLSGDVILVNGVADRVNADDREALFALLDKKYGNARKTQGTFMNPFDIYTWQAADRLIKYVPLFDDTQHTLHVVADKSKGTLSGASGQSHYKGLIYIISKEYARKLVGNMHTGDLLYCDE